MITRRGNPGGPGKPGGGGGGPNSNRPAERLPVSASLSSSWLVRKCCSATIVPTPTPAHTKANRITCETSSRVRSDHVRGERKRVSPVISPWPTGRSARRFEDIAGAAQCVDHRLAPIVDLLAQIRDIKLDDVGPPTEVVTPHAVQDLGLAQNPLGVAHHEPQQLELCRGQRDQVPRAGHFVTVLVEHQITDDYLGA